MQGMDPKYRVKVKGDKDIGPRTVISQIIEDVLCFLAAVVEVYKDVAKSENCICPWDRYSVVLKVCGWLGLSEKNCYRLLSTGLWLNFSIGWTVSSAASANFLSSRVS
jgi:hypothetical protein